MIRFVVEELLESQHALSRHATKTYYMTRRIR